DACLKGPPEKKLCVVYKRLLVSTSRASRRTASQYLPQSPKSWWKSPPEQATVAPRNSYRADLLATRIRGRSTEGQPYHPETSSSAPPKARRPRPRSRRQGHAPCLDS